MPRLSGLRSEGKKYIRIENGQQVSEELFDLEEDPGERRNRLEDLPEIAARLRERNRARAASNRDAYEQSGAAAAAPAPLTTRSARHSGPWGTSSDERVES